MLDLSNCMW